MDIYLIRHTHVQIEEGTCYGQTDVPLADTFTQEITAMQNKLVNLPQDILIISSPLQRCLQLAQALSHHHPITTDDRLKEMNFGDWEQQKWAQLEQSRLQEWMENYIASPPPHGESFLDFAQRVQTFWQTLMTHQDYQTVLVITHAGVISAILAHILEIPLKKALCFQIDFGSIHKLKYYPNDKPNEIWTRIEYLNR